MATATLVWTAGGGVTQEVYYRKEGDVSFILFDTVSGDTSTIDITGIDPNEVYEFYILNKCNYGLEVMSEVKEAALVTCPELITFYQGAITLTIEFSNLEGDITDYRVETYELPGETLLNTIDITPAFGPISFTYDGLTPDTYYKFKVIPRIGSEYLNETCEFTERTFGCEPDYTLAPDGSYC